MQAKMLKVLIDVRSDASLASHPITLRLSLQTLQLGIRYPNSHTTIFFLY